MWYSGQKVVCLCSDWENRPPNIVPPERCPVEGEVYTLHSIDAPVTRECDLPAGMHWFCLVEMECDVFFRSDHFRPACDKPTDISALVEIARKQSAPAPKLPVASIDWHDDVDRYPHPFLRGTWR